MTTEAHRHEHDDYAHHVKMLGQWHKAASGFSFEVWLTDYIAALEAEIDDVVRREQQQYNRVIALEAEREVVVKTRIAAREYDHLWDGKVPNEWDGSESQRLWSLHAEAIHAMEAAYRQSHPEVQ